MIGRASHERSDTPREVETGHRVGSGAAGQVRHDAYPSRVGGDTMLLPRKDPVLHGVTAQPGPLSRAQLESFERDGFLALPHFFDESEAQTLRDAAFELRDGLATADEPAVIREPESGCVRSIFGIHATDRVLGGLARHPGLLGAAMQILASPVYVHQSRVNYKPAFRGRDFYWHSDFETWHVEDGMPRMRALSVSVNLLENNSLNGPLMLMPGSHEQYISCSGSTPERHYEHSLRRQENGLPDPEVLEEMAHRRGIVAPAGGPGSVLLFDCNTIHGSNNNITPWPRSNVFFVYNSVHNTLERPFSGQAPRPTFIAQRDFAPLEAARAGGRS